MRLAKNIKWVLPCLMASFMLIFGGCGDDEPENDPDTPPVENPQPGDNDQEEQPGEDTEKPDEGNDQDQDEPDTDQSKYYTPTEDELVGPWNVYKEFVEEWHCYSGTWKKTKTEWVEGSALDRYDYNFPYFIAFLKYGNENHENHKMIWSYSSVGKYYSILKAIENKETKTFGNVEITDGKISGKVYDWSWQPNINDRSMMILKSGSNVSYRWEITKFDGEQFILTNYFNDMPKPVDGGLYYTYKRYYKRFPNSI